MIVAVISEVFLFSFIKERFIVCRGSPYCEAWVQFMRYQIDLYEIFIQILQYWKTHRLIFQFLAVSNNNMKKHETVNHLSIAAVRFLSA